MKKKALKLTGIIFAIALVFSSSVLAGCGKQAEASSKTPITIETMGLPAPFIITVEDEKDAVYTTKDGQYLTGYDIAVLVELFKLPSFANYELDLSINSNGLIDAQEGVIDATVNNWSYNKERAESYLFSYPYTKSRYSITASKGVEIHSFEELAESGLAVYGSAGGNTTNAIERWNDARTDGQAKINLEYTSVDITVELQDAINGKVVLIGDQPVILSWKQSYPAQFEQLTTTVLSDEETAKNITAYNTSHILFGKTGKNSKEYQKLFSEGIKELYDNGTLEQLGKKYVAEPLGDDAVDVLPLESEFVYLN